MGFDLSVVVAAVVVSLAALASGVRAAEPVRYILDTDIASDCDDAGAVAMVNSLIDTGEAHVLAMMVSTGGQYGAPCLSAINTWHGHGEIPIGTLKDPKFWVGGSPDLPAGARNYESYNRVIAERYPVAFRTGDEAPDARVLYRQILSTQPDQSVVINTIGPLINIAHLMETPADEISPLDGMELIRRKVKMLVVCGGRQPAGTSSNFSKENAGIHAKPVIDRFPAPIVFVGNEVGHVIYTDWERNRAGTQGSPARLAYELFHKTDGKTRHHSADQAGVLYAIRGETDVYEVVREGHLTCDAAGQSKWSAEAAPAGQQHGYVRKLENVDERIKAVVEELMTATPAARR